ncbi:hypothetical protein EDF53_1355 [Curtobacterium sp. PhB78]|nr:hypothetical protein EDF53_1355 [Curtobacterium sp. PhB78]
MLTDASVRRGDVFAEDPDPAILAVGAADVLAAVDRLDVLGVTAQATDR